MPDIDFVFLWVDPSDPAWAAKRDAYLRAHPEIPADAFLPVHFSDHGELRYAIRSIETFAPFFRRIFLVTDGQRPAWLKGHPRLALVHHRDFFAPDTPYPVFSPDAIESQVHRIPGLSERFVYANDDTLLTAPVTPADFYDEDGTALIRMTGERVRVPRADDIKWRWIWHNAALLLSEKLGDGGVPWSHTDHQMLAMRKSACEGAEEFFAGEFRFIRSCRHRSRQGIAPLALFAHWAIRRGLARAVPAERGLYIDARKPDAAYRAALHTLRLPVPERPLFACLNDNAAPGDAGEVYALATRALEELLPQRSFCEEAV